MNYPRRRANKNTPRPTAGRNLNETTLPPGNVFAWTLRAFALVAVVIVAWVVLIGINMFAEVTA